MALCTLLVFYVYALYFSFPIPPILASLLVMAFALALVPFNPPPRCLFVFMLLILSLFLERFALGKGVVSSSLPLESVRLLEGVAVEDGREGKFFRDKVRVSLRQVADYAGNRGNASGILFISGMSGKELVFADRLTVTGYFDNEGFFHAKRIRVSSRSRFILFRMEIIARLEKVFSSFSYGNLALMLFLGTASSDEAIMALGRESGCAYVLALSGMHLAFFSSILSFLLSFVMDKKMARVMTLAFLFAYVALMGFKPSLLRAFIFRLLAVLLPSLPPLGRLFLSYIVQAFVFPESLTLLSAAYSYLSLAGILCFSSQVALVLPLPHGIASGFATSFAALAVSQFLSLYVFGSAATGSLVISIPLGIVLFIFMASALASVFLPPFAVVARGSERAMEALMAFGARFPHYTSYLTASVLLAILLLLFLLSFTLCRKERGRVA